MANYLQVNPVGVDVSIQNIQKFIYDRIGWSNIDVFGRIYKVNEKPSAFISKNEYREVFTNDKKSAYIYFIVEDKHNTEDGISFEIGVKIVFLVNLKLISGESDTRPDSLVQKQAIDCINKVKMFHFNDGLETGIENVFKGFNIKSLEKIDLNPFHVFSLNGQIVYNEKCAK